MAGGWCRSRPAATGTARLVHEPIVFVTAIGAGTTYPDYKPAPFIVSSEIDGVDMVTVVTEGIFSYCGVKVKIDTDRYLGPETATVRAQGEAIGHVTTSEYGSQMLSLGGVHHLTGGSKKEGRVTCDALMDLSNCKPVELTIDGGATVVVQAGYPPIVNGVAEERMRVGCGSATIGMFAKQWHGKVDEVVVVDDHITGVLSEHQAGKLLDIPDTGIKMKGRRSTPGRYFQVAEPGTGWGGTKISDPLSVLGPFDPKDGAARHDHADGLHHRRARGLLRTRRGACGRSRQPMPPDLRLSVERIQENCEPALCTVLFMGGAGGSLRAGVTDNPVRLTRSVKDALTRVTSGGAPVYVWPGGGITFMVDVTRLPAGAFGYVPTPALVAPIEFTLRLSDYAALGGHMDHVRPLASLKDNTEFRPMPSAAGAGTAHMSRAPQIRLLADGKRLHLQDGPIDLIVEARGSEAKVRAAYDAAARRFTGLLDELCDELPLLRAGGRSSSAACCKAPSRAACMPRWRRLPAITSSRRWRRSRAPSRKKFLARWCGRRALDRAYVNNGGDIALHLAPGGERFTVGLMDRPDRHGLMRTIDHRCRRSLAGHCDQRAPWAQFLARHRRRRDRAGADRVASRRCRHHHCQCGRPARSSCHPPRCPAQGFAAGQRSRRAAGHARCRRVVRR